MASIFKWVAPESIATALTTDLNSLANGSYSAASAAIDNETDLYTHLDLEVYLGSLTPTGTPTVSAYLVPSVDGTNYTDGGGATAPPIETLIAVLSLSTSTGAKYRSATNIPIPPLKFKLILLNSSGVALASSGNTLKYRRHNGQAV